ncbi:Metal-dependent hydrolase, endonuclease/exonuclease/phosphatase family [Cognatiyoonia koreensis]|uniref:Metal-dependent hydrolase, endonuclease/exonuclease/phosphatase family n=2 Tax=Cognatiyoonia koreensis TaxID=364200 RepID=A0A1I0RUY6_9RHOB|nr:Metal-dependent hydrolase, endonuclease/exonuclease/phosphatase family [Cognatiyoonia koreensis]
MIKLMKASLATLLALLTITGCQHIRNSGSEPVPVASAQMLRLATYNVHYIIMQEETGPWSLGDWERRKVPMDQAFKAVDADIIAFQEMESFAGRSESDVNLALDWLLANNPDYAAAAVGPVDTFPSTQPILYRRDRFKVLDQGWFFFSDTPDVIYARTFNGSYPAFASWALFEDAQNGQDFCVINIHTDYRSRSNRLQSIALVAERIRPWISARETVFAVGDLNARLGSAALGILEDEGVVFVPVDGATYHFDRGINLFGAIDHIGYVGAASLTGGPFVLREKFNDVWPTDHYPLVADFVLGSTDS